MKSAVCIYACDDASTIQERIAYHKVIGFDTIIVYDNLSRDNTAELALEMAAVVDVRVINWPDATPRTAETEAYRDCCTRHAAEFDWIAFISCAELIACPVDERIGALLGRCVRDSAIALNWAIFGSNHLIEAPSGLEMECFDRRAPDDFGPNQHVKMIIRPDRMTGLGNPHYFEVDGPVVTALGQPVDWLHGGVLTSVNLSSWRVHKYFTRSRSQWQRKIDLGYTDIVRTPEVFADYDRNDLRDRTATRFSSPVWALLDAVRGA